MKNKFAYLLLTFLLTGCSINKLAPSRIDSSTTWEDNYYTNWDESLRNIETTKVNVTLDNKVFETFGENNFNELESDHTLTYDDYNEEKGFGHQRKLSKYNPLVKEGFVSKLFDGQLFCNGNYEKARIQIKESGFSSSFFKPIQKADYLFLNFKSALDFKQHTPTPHYDNITIHISLFGNTNVTYSYSLINVPTNYGEAYMFFGFSLKEFDISGVTDFAITYTLDSDPYNETHPNNQAPHSLLLYEFGFGNPTY